MIIILLLLWILRSLWILPSITVDKLSVSDQRAMEGLSDDSFLWTASPVLFWSGENLVIAISQFLKVQSTRLTEVSQSQQAKPQHWHERKCTVACFSSLAHTSAQCPDTCRRSSCCFLTFSQTPGLRHRLCVLYIRTLIQMYASCIAAMSVLRISSALGWLSQVSLATNSSDFKGKQMYLYIAILCMRQAIGMCVWLEQREMLADQTFSSLCMHVIKYLTIKTNKNKQKKNYTLCSCITVALVWIFGHRSEVWNIRCAF